jgi:mortality factor 4-like protein 1
MGSSNTNANNSSGGGKDKDDETSPSFKEGERVLAYHGPLLYEAKVRPYLPFHSNPT